VTNPIFSMLNFRLVPSGISPTKNQEKNKAIKLETLFVFRHVDSRKSAEAHLIFVSQLRLSLPCS
jgi:hypothetical protein